MKAEEFTDWVFKDFDYEPTGAYLFQDGTGSVSVDVQSPDMTEFGEIFADKASDFADSADVEAMSEKDFYLAMGNLLRESMKETPTSTKYLSIDVYRDGDTWKVDEESLSSEIEYAFSGLL